MDSLSKVDIGRKRIDSTFIFCEIDESEIPDEILSEGNIQKEAIRGCVATEHMSISVLLEVTKNIPWLNESLVSPSFNEREQAPTFNPLCRIVSEPMSCSNLLNINKREKYSKNIWKSSEVSNVPEPVIKIEMYRAKGKVYSRARGSHWESIARRKPRFVSKLEKPWRLLRNRFISMEEIDCSTKIFKN